MKLKNWNKMNWRKEREKMQYLHGSATIQAKSFWTYVFHLWVYKTNFKSSKSYVRFCISALARKHGITLGSEWMIMGFFIRKWIGLLIKTKSKMLFRPLAKQRRTWRQTKQCVNVALRRENYQRKNWMYAKIIYFNKRKSKGKK
jgi:hypothetical protein